MTKTINSLIASFSGSAIIAIPRAYINLLDGDYPTAAMLSQLVYWSDKCSDENGWVYKKHEDFRNELGLSKFQVMRASQFLEAANFIERKLQKIGTAPTSHYRVRFDKLIDALMADDEPEPEEVIGEVSHDLDMFFNTPPPPPPPKRTADEYKQSIASALQQGGERMKHMVGNRSQMDVYNYLTTVPEYIRGLAEVFCKWIGRPPTKREDSMWRKGWIMQYDIGIRPEDVAWAIPEMERRGLTIKSPQSVVAIAEEGKRDRMQSSAPKLQKEVLISKGAESLVNNKYERRTQ